MAGKLVLDSKSHHLDQTVLNHVQCQVLERKEEAIKKRNKEQLSYMKLCYNADKILEKNDNQDVSKWKRKDDIITNLKLLKRKEDTKFPLLCKDMNNFIMIGKIEAVVIVMTLMIM